MGVGAGSAWDSPMGVGAGSAWDSPMGVGAAFSVGVLSSESSLALASCSGAGSGFSRPSSEGIQSTLLTASRKKVTGIKASKLYLQIDA